MEISPAVDLEYSSSDNTFSRSVTDDLSLPLSLEIGDSKQPDFIPQLKLMKWDNEVNFSMRLADDDYTAGATTTDGNKMIWTKGPLIASFYTKSVDDQSAEIMPAQNQVRSALDIAQAPQLLYRYLQTDDYNDGSIFEDISELIGTPTLRMLVLEMTKPTIVLNGIYTKGKFIDTDKVPDSMTWARKLTLGSFGTIVYDPGNIEFSFIGGAAIDDDTFIEAILTAVQGLGIKAYRSEHRPDSNDLVFKSVDGIEKKFCGFGRNWADSGDFFINVSTDFTKYDFYTPSNGARTSVKGSLNEIVPTITNQQVVDAVMSELAAAVGMDLSEDSISDEEQALIDQYKPIYNDAAWIEGAVMDNFTVQRAYSDPNIVGDTVEFDITLTEAPASNVIAFSMQTKGLEFLYQPPLTDEQRNTGTFSPVDVVSSYAIYHATERNDYSLMGGNNYATGKVAHLYRPKITDANGSFVWGDLDYDQSSGTMNLTIPKEWLDDATYPVLIDPTFGRTTIGGSSLNFVSGSNDVIRGNQVTGAAGIGASMSFYGKQDNAIHKSQMALYDQSTSPAFITGTGTVTISGIQNAGAVGWNTANFNSPPTLSAIGYTMYAWGNNVSKVQNQTIQGDITGGVSKDSSVGQVYTDQSWPATITPTTSTNLYSLYVTYTTGGSVPTLAFMGAG